MRDRFGLLTLMVMLEVTVAPTTRPGEPRGAACGEGRAQDQARPAIPITISKETTRILGPLREDGYVDYVTALNQMTSEGVTPENNAAVLLWQAAGPAEIPEEIRERFFQLTGIAPLPEEGDYLVPFDHFSVPAKDLERAGLADLTDEQSKGILRRQYDEALERSWSADEFPVLISWLEANAKPMRRLLQATHRPRFYCPLIATNGPTPLASVAEPAGPASWLSAHLLKMRAMLRVGQGNVDQAWEDLLACHRLARLVGQGPLLPQTTRACLIDGFASLGDAALAHHAELTSQQARKLLDDLDALPPMPRVVDRLDPGERFYTLDIAAAAARQEPAAINYLFGSEPPHAVGDRLRKYLTGQQCDWDRVLRTSNSLFDRFIEAARQLPRAQRDRAVAQFAEEAREMAREMCYPWATIGWALGTDASKAVVARGISGILAYPLSVDLAAIHCEEHACMRFDLARISLALAAYRSDQGAYPAELSQLSPKYLSEVPKDLFTGRALRYQRRDDGYLLYSFGSNMKDDGGQDHDFQRLTEDIVVQTPQ